MFGLFKSKPKYTGPQPTGTYYNQWEHTGWGNAIVIDNWEQCKISGHLPFYLKVGDEIRFRMSSGNVGRVLISSVRQMSDPPDMFFATFHPLGYLEGTAEPEVRTNRVRFLI